MPKASEILEDGFPIDQGCPRQHHPSHLAKTPAEINAQIQPSAPFTTESLESSSSHTYESLWQPKEILWITPYSGPCWTASQIYRH
jgi:hypothetical protein